MNAKQLSALVNKIIKRHGPVIDLRKNPELLIEIVRGFGSQIAGNDNPCGGTPPAPVPPAPAPAGLPGATNEDVIRAVRGLSSEINALTKAISATSLRRS